MSVAVGAVIVKLVSVNRKCLVCTIEPDGAFVAGNVPVPLSNQFDLIPFLNLMFMVCSLVLLHFFEQPS